ncbi:MAG: right-handed parallel beta-helix repeat-containing protein [Methylococcaceae bacterium]
MNKLTYTLLCYFIIPYVEASPLCIQNHPPVSCGGSTPVIISSNIGLNATDMSIINACSKTLYVPVIRVLSGVTLDLCAHTIDCNPSNNNGANSANGIQLDGSNITLLDGTVKGCLYGVVSYANNSSHKINRVTASGNAMGFDINANNVRTQNSVANDNNDRGFSNSGNSNKYYANIANGNWTGFSNYSQYASYGGPLALNAGNVSTSNITYGFFDAGSIGTKLYKNLANANRTGGFQIGNINANAVYQANTATANADYGIAVYNVSNGSFNQNITTDNNSAGIHNYTNSSNIFTNNFSSGNNNTLPPTPFDDMIDNASATWIGNFCGFGTLVSCLP